MFKKFILQPTNGCEKTDDAVKSLKLCMGKIEPMDDYTYVRGRGL